MLFSNLCRVKGESGSVPISDRILSLSRNRLPWTWIRSERHGFSIPPKLSSARAGMHQNHRAQASRSNRLPCLNPTSTVDLAGRRLNIFLSRNRQTDLNSTNPLLCTFAILIARFFLENRLQLHFCLVISPSVRQDFTGVCRGCDNM